MHLTQLTSFMGTVAFRLLIGAGTKLFVAALISVWAASCDSSGDSPPPVSTYEHIRASWSPDGSTIAFTARIRDTLGIYLIDVTGANLRLLKEGEGIGASWSPDSRWIAFSAGDSIYKM